MANIRHLLLLIIAPPPSPSPSHRIWPRACGTTARPVRNLLDERSDTRSVHLCRERVSAFRVGSEMRERVRIIVGKKNMWLKTLFSIYFLEHAKIWAVLDHDVVLLQSATGRDLIIIAALPSQLFSVQVCQYPRWPRAPRARAVHAPVRHWPPFATARRAVPRPPRRRLSTASFLRGGQRW